jgi:hypothetical protein
VRLLSSLLGLILILVGCGPEPSYQDVSDVTLPQEALGGFSMDAQAADLDGDGDLDLLVAQEYKPNILLMNQGEARFTNESGRIPRADRDSEDIAVADFDGDGDLDVVVVSEDDRINEYYRNLGPGTFENAGRLIPVGGRSNAAIAHDFSGDGYPDLLIGNNGQNALLLADGEGGFSDGTDAWLPRRNDVTQDVEAGDVDGDGDLDLIVGNEDENRLLINRSGRFLDETAARLPLIAQPEETREADFGDVDGDGDLDILFANVRAFVTGADRQNRLLVNDGSGVFSDQTGERLPADYRNAFDGDFLDLDGDGDLDIILAQAEQGWRAPAPYAVWENDGTGRYTEATERFLQAQGPGFDIEAFDTDGDGIPELYLANRGVVPDMLLRKPN